MRTIQIRFDGGTSCNIPRLGYGNGYGSYQIDDNPIYRLSFNIPMSANAAEIRTLARAIETVSQNEIHTALIRLSILGDSRVALKWANVAAGKRKRTKIANTSSEFQESILMLERFIRRGWADVMTTWTPRQRSVAVFGH